MPKLTNLKYVFRHLKNWVFIKNKEIKYFNPNFSASSIQNTSIIFVHGAVDKAGAFNDLIDGLLPTLSPQITYLISVSFRGLDKGIAAYADKLIQIIKKTGSSDVILIGHSRGGIICAYAAEYFAVENKIKIRGIIAIASPFHGSKYIQYPLTAFMKSMDEMRIDSELIKNLRELLNQNQHHYKYFFISGGEDLLVETNSSVLVIPGSQSKIFPDYGHLSILHAPEFKTYIFDIIRRLVSKY
jgi:predicted esterase